MRAGLVARAEDWPWDSFWRIGEGWAALGPKLTPWPIERPDRWPERVNEPFGPLEEQARSKNGS